MPLYRAQRFEPRPFTGRKPRVFQPHIRTIRPLRLTGGQQPIRSHDRQTIQRMAQRFSHTDESIDRAEFGQYMRRIRPLFAACFEPNLLLEHGQHHRHTLFFAWPSTSRVRNSLSTKHHSRDQRVRVPMRPSTRCDREPHQRPADRKALRHIA